MNLYFRILISVIQYAKTDSRELARSRYNIFFLRFFCRIWYFIDMVMCYIFFLTYTNDYLKYELYKKSFFLRIKEHKLWKLTSNYKLISEYKRKRIKILKMLNKYSSIDYELPRKNKERLKKYKEMFNMGDKCKVQFGVIMEIAHYQLGEIKIGNGVLLARNVDIDYTGGLEIGNGVGILEGVKILTHSHDSLGLKGTSDMKSRGVKKIHLSKLFIEDNVTIGTRAIIMPGVGRIGENSIISAGSIVRKRVPPNAIVAGNPAEIVTIFPADRRSKRWNEEEYDLVNPKKLLKKKG